MTFPRSPGWIARTMRRRWLVTGAVGGIAIGSAVGALAVAAPSDAARVPRIRVLHAAPAFARADSALELSAATVCDRPSSPACRVSAAFASVRTDASSGWTRVRGVSSSGGYRFSVPGSLVGSTGLDYRLAFRTADGSTTTYPPAGVPLHVSSTDGLVTSRVAGGFSWKRVRRPDRRELFLAYGDAPGEVGTEGGDPGQDLLGPSSFALAEDGAISVVDWVNDRVEVFRGGEVVRTFATPSHRTFDIASGTAGRSYLLSLGSDGVAYEVAPAGGVVGRYPPAFGVPSRVTITSTGPAVQVGPAQWLSVRSAAGAPRSAGLQASTVSASPVGRSGSSTRFGIVDGGHIALTWVRADGSSGGTLLALPERARPGTEYFARPLRDGGVLLALGLWNESHNGVGLFRFSSSGSVQSFSLLPEPSTRADARASTVRFLAPDRVLVAYDHRHGMSIDAFEVGGR